MDRYVLIDMNTQRDFLLSGGAAPVHNHEVVVQNIRKMLALARTYQVPIISAVDSHRETEPPHDGFPRHCIEGTPGQKKLKFTLLQKRIFVEANNSLDLPRNLFDDYRQVIFRRRTSDFLDNPKADCLISALSGGEFVIFGVGLERSVRRLVLCLLSRGYRVSYVPSACGCWNETDADLTRRLLAAKGAGELSIGELTGLFKSAARPRIQRIFSKPRTATKRRRPLAS